MKVICPYCGSSASLVDGKVIYPHRPDLSSLAFYECKPCKAYVGCHKGTITPLGRLANAELRTAKLKAHASFDPIWKTNQMSRTDAYKWLSKELSIAPDKCHIGMFDVVQCELAITACKIRTLNV